MFSFAMLYQVFNTMGAIVGNLAQQFNYLPRDTSIFGVIFIMGGLLGSFSHAIALDKWRKFKIQIIICGIGTIISLAGIMLVIDYNSLWATTALLGFFGFNNIPIISLSYSFGCFLVYPIGEAVASGILMMFASFLSTIFTVIVSWAITYSRWNSLYLFVVSTCVSLFCAFLI